MNVWDTMKYVKSCFYNAVTFWNIFENFGLIFVTVEKA